uniref:Uncharacterized protein n=1 Tax=Phasianus colchicus TaxID=9054 RepID=A0A669PZ77_PHACC
LLSPSHTGAVRCRLLWQILSSPQPCFRKCTCKGKSVGWNTWGWPHSRPYSRPLTSVRWLLGCCGLSTGGRGGRVALRLRRGVPAPWMP